MIVTGGALVLAPHPDDEISCAGMIARCANNNEPVTVVAFSACEESVPDGFGQDSIANEFAASCKTLGVEGKLYRWPVRRFSEHRQDILEAMVHLREDLRPSLVLCPSSDHVHQDHRVIHEEARRAFPRVRSLLGYESPHGGDGCAQLRVELSEKHLEQKLAALRCYRTQMGRTNMSPELYRSLARVRGVQFGADSGLAEAYQVISARLV